MSCKLKRLLLLSGTSACVCVVWRWASGKLCNRFDHGGSWKTLSPRTSNGGPPLEDEAKPAANYTGWWLAAAASPLHLNCLHLSLVLSLSLSTVDFPSQSLLSELFSSCSTVSRETVIKTVENSWGQQFRWKGLGCKINSLWVCLCLTLSDCLVS